MSDPHRHASPASFASRRRMLTHMARGLAVASLSTVNARWLSTTLAGVAAGAPTENQVRDYLRPFVMARSDVDAWFAARAFPFCKYDPELGYLHIDRDFKEGIGGAICRYRYDRLGARRMFAHADQPCRINTYGNSFTSCEQTSDGETWQEVLASHLGEPVRNYGIGGYSVYQAYLRMRREEQRAPAKYIIFNVFDDDHYRNLHGWQRFRFGVNRISPNPTVPYVRVDPDKNEFRELPNPCPTRESVYELCDADTIYKKFRDDVILQARADREARRKAGQPASDFDFDDPELTRLALFASAEIVKRVEAFAAAHERRVLYVLSYNPGTIRRFLTAGTRFDQDFVAFLDRRRLPYVDLLKAHAADYARFRGTPDEYLARYFIGHYNPLGNFFCAFAILPKLVEMLDPKPPAYAR